MKVNVWAQQAQRELEHAGIGTARLDVLVLLEDALNKSSTHILAHQEIKLSTAQQKILNAQLARRATHEPLAYIRGKTEFYGREFIITSDVLEPRPESETMIELLLKQQDLPAKPRLADIGTGSGALGITAKLELPEASVDLIEIDPDAINTTKMNVIKHTTNVSILHSDLLTGTPQDYDIMLCNLPYVPDGFGINEAAMREPKIAIFGGADGLDLYRKLFKQINNIPKKPLLILCESLPPQHEALEIIGNESGYRVAAQEDFIQAFKL